MEYKKLNNGLMMPKLGYGVYQIPPEQTEGCVVDALEVGYRLIDTAHDYGNEAEVGSGIEKSGIDRSEVFVTSKVWISSMNYERAKASIKESAEKLGGYVDLLLLHEAFGDYHGAYRALEEAYDEGTLKAIGLSNFLGTRLVDVCALARITPMVNQIETNPFRQERKDHELMASIGVAHEAWSPFGEGEKDVFQNPVLTEIGKNYGKTAAQVILRALLQEDVIVIPKTVHKDRMEENFDVFDFSLTDQEMERFKSLDDPSTSRLFDPYDVGSISWLLNDQVRDKELNGEPLF